MSSDLIKKISNSNLAILIVIRLLSAAITVALFWFFPTKYFMSFYLMIGYTHYIGGVFYSQKQLQEVFSTQKTALIFTGLIASGAMLHFAHFPVFIFFGIHHLFSEIYMANRFLLPEEYPEKNPLFLSRFSLQAFAYLYFIRGESTLPPWFPVLFVKAGLLVLVGIFLATIAKKLKHPEHRQALKPIIIFEILTLIFWAVAGLTADPNYVLPRVVLYHGITWFFYPLPNMIRTSGFKPVVRFFVGFLPLFVLIALFTPLAERLLGTNLPWIIFNTDQTIILVALGGFLHIAASFPLSSANPKWIKNLFFYRGRVTA